MEKDLILSLPIDNLSIIINYLESKEIFRLIETYPSIRSNEDLWKKVIFLTSVESPIKSSKKIGTYFTTYIHMICSIYWRCDIIISYPKHDSLLLDNKFKLLRNFEELITILAIDIYLNFIYHEMKNSYFEDLLGFEIFKYLFDNGCDKDYYQNLKMNQGISSTYMEKQLVIKKLVEYIKSKIDNNSITIHFKSLSLKIKLKMCMLK